jgi:hypothetical protein
VAPAGGGSLIGLSFPHDGSCRIILDRNLRNVPARECEVYAHEYGHLAGAAHSADPADLMAPVVPAFKPCRAALPELAG